MRELPNLGVRATVVKDGETQEVEIVSYYSLHVALYALQQGTTEACARALELIGRSGDVDGHMDPESGFPLPVPEPARWT